uniref:Mitochondrial resolvase Ydc2 catalytic domain-containing protein n=1 Tax=viral metagenome TaxID=1070528 RepID=A0A6C0I9Q6_9ZZZZ
MKILSFDVGVVNLAYCIFDTSNCKILHWEVISLENHNDYNKIYINLIKQLDLRKHLLDVNQVIIEKQPSFNPKMRIISGCLQTYFIIRGIVDIPESGIKCVKFFSPKHKLKCYNGPELVLDSVVKSKYSRTKKMGVLICRSKLKEYLETSENTKLFENSKKKDDLSDCYLQAITYSIFEKLIPSTINETGRVSGPIILNKTQIKAQIKELIQNHSNLHELSPELQENITKKYSISFPLESIDQLLGPMNLKRYAKSII